MSTFPKAERGSRSPAILVRPANSTFTHIPTGITYIQTQIPLGNTWVVHGTPVPPADGNGIYGGDGVIIPNTISTLGDPANTWIIEGGRIAHINANSHILTGTEPGDMPLVGFRTLTADPEIIFQHSALGSASYIKGIGGGFNWLLPPQSGTFAMVSDIPTVNTLEIDPATIAGYIDVDNGDDGNDGLTLVTAKASFVGMIASGIPTGTIYVIAGAYANSVGLEQDSFSADPLYTWYLETGVTLTQTLMPLSGDVTDPGAFFIGMSRILIIRGNGVIRYAGNGSMLDSTTSFDLIADIECKTFQYVASGGAPYADACILSADAIDVVSITLGDNGSIGYLVDVEDTNYFITARDTSFFKSNADVSILSKDDVDITALAISRNAAGFLRYESSIGGGTSQLFEFGIRFAHFLNPFDVLTRYFVNYESTAGTPVCNLNYPTTELGNAIIIATGGTSPNIQIETATTYGGHVDINSGSLTMKDMRYSGFGGIYNFKLIARGTGSFNFDNCDLNGEDALIELLAAGCSLDLKNSTLRCTTGDTVFTDTTDTRILRCNFNSGGFAVNSTALTAINMDFNVGDKALNNITDTIGNYVPNAAWAGL